MPLTEWALPRNYTDLIITLASPPISPRHHIAQPLCIHTPEAVTGRTQRNGINKFYFCYYWQNHGPGGGFYVPAEDYIELFLNTLPVGGAVGGRSVDPV